jgi:hypothetical protein
VSWSSVAPSDSRGWRSGAMIARERLVKRRTGDGLMEIADHVLLGKVYRVVLASRRLRTGINVDHRRLWTREMIEDADHPGEWLPTELLAIE